MAKINVKIGENESEYELTAEQLEAIKSENNYLTKEEALANQDFFEAHKNKHKKEVLDGFDAILKAHEKELTAEEMEAYKKGETTFKKADSLITLLKTRLANKGDNTELEMWKAEVEKERKLRETGFITKEEFEKTQKSFNNLNKQIIGNYALTESIASGKLDDKFKGNKYFKDMLKAAMNDTLKQGLDGKPAKVTYDLETGDIKVVSTGDGNLPIIKAGTTNYWSFADLIDKVLIDNQFNKTAQTPKEMEGQNLNQNTGQGTNHFTSVANERLNQLKNKFKQE